ncbi:cyclin-D5-1-like [Salvia miltiorrhiza]|uniref:cyclin-D5-1-like n=1 Tax=Salvia miltiorrhiza TaxID=226208 RepID=UPI0025ABBB84|nr:cyclin-D5-1-like [Salvia miltiorrhiza]
MESRTFLPNLLCEESNILLREKEDENVGFCSVSESDSEFIEMMLKNEASFQPDGDANSVLTEGWWFQSVRSGIIKWILQKRAEFGYHYRTAYLSLVYFDRYLTRVKLSEGKLMKLQILSIACLSLAAKMEECEARLLAEYTREGYQFCNTYITKMELIVLSTLDWRMCCITPFTFLTYFAAKFCQQTTDHHELILRAKQLILSIMQEIDVAKHRPSIIAAASVLAAYDKHLSKTALESKMDAVPSLENESIISCYSLMQEIVEAETPESVVSQNPLNDDSTSTSRGTRRRLNFDDCDQDCPPPKK